MDHKPMRWHDGRVIHECRGERAVPFDAGTYLVWTRCQRDVPANAAIYSNEEITCEACCRMGKLALRVDEVAMSKKAKRAIEMNYKIVLDCKYKKFHAVRFDRKKASCGADILRYGTKIGENAHLCKKCAPIITSVELASIRSQIDRCQQAIEFLQQALIT